jgi:hypothetical protein
VTQPQVLTGEEEEDMKEIMSRIIKEIRTHWTEEIIKSIEMILGIFKRDIIFNMQACLALFPRQFLQIEIAMMKILRFT